MELSQFVTPGDNTQAVAEWYYQEEQKARFMREGLYILSDMKGHHYQRMLHDIYGPHYANRWVDYRAQYVHLPEGKRLSGFAGFDGFGEEGKQVMFQAIEKMCQLRECCDWLDYNGFLRPKWMPNGGRSLTDCLPLISYDQ